MDLIRVPETALVGPRPALRNPVLIAGFGASGNHTPESVMAQLIHDNDAELIAEFDPDELFDVATLRPTVTLDGAQRVLEWPSVGFHRATVTDPALGERDIVLLSGAEPHLHWRRFAAAVVEFARREGIPEVLLVSAFGGATPHTRPAPLMWVPLTGAGVRNARFGVDATLPKYQGPATFTMALGVMLRDAGLDVSGLNAIAPFYLGIDPSPHAGRALAEALAREYGFRVDFTHVDEQLAEVHRQAAEQMASNPNLTAFIAKLEQQYDAGRTAQAEAPREAEPLPETESVLAGVEALLAHARHGNSGPDRR